MAAEIRCRHDMPFDQCGICNPPRPELHDAADSSRYGRDTSKFGPWFPARYDGECDGCGEPFSEGDDIRSDGEGGWLASCCGDNDGGGE